MDVLTPVVVGALLTVWTIVLTWIARGQFDALRAEFGGLRAEFAGLRAEFDDLRADVATFKADVNRRLDRVEAELAELRTMVMQLAIALGARPRPQTG